MPPCALLCLWPTKLEFERRISIGIQELVKQIKPGVSIIDIDEASGEGIIRQVGNGWVIIKWVQLGGEWGTPLEEVVLSILRRQWILLDNWCSKLLIPEKKNNVYRNCQRTDIES